MHRTRNTNSYFEANQMNELMIKVENVSKQYQLGQIGGTTLRDELQRWGARIRGEEDPTKVIGSKMHNTGEPFMALCNVSFDVKKGERIGIIGHNGAGKSTLLKLISRVTAPSSGIIGLNGRVASMLEVGTGFHGELTGRENIYMNGAILGMTKREIDDKISEIIEFSECCQFIDTPVKRYSSGMYVKLAFAVAAHLDSEIMIMDEVLAVGDMKFQKKCLGKMDEESSKSGKTILYVSHNMATIRALCDRCIVLNKGEIIFDGDTEKGIQLYSGGANINSDCIDTSKFIRQSTLNQRAFVYKVEVIDNDKGYYTSQDHLRLRFYWINYLECKTLVFRIFITNSGGHIVSTTVNRTFVHGENDTKYIHELDIKLNNLAPDFYNISLRLTNNEESRRCDYDWIENFMVVEVRDNEPDPIFRTFNANVFGNLKLPDIEIKETLAEPVDSNQ